MICKGSLFYLNIENKFITEDSLTTIHYESNVPVLYEYISLDNYPSWNDFSGKKTNISHGDPVIVLEYVGRPFKIRSGDNLNQYNVYRVQLNSGEVRCVFEYNLSKSIILPLDVLPTS